jgi:hypothetical protein
MANPIGVPCPREDCDGVVEGSAKVYFDVTRLSEDGEDVTDMEFSRLNDTYDGHPCALEAEVDFYCSNDHELSFSVAGRAAERSDMNGLGF